MIKVLQLQLKEYADLTSENDFDSIIDNIKSELDSVNVRVKDNTEESGMDGECEARSASDA